MDKTSTDHILEVAKETPSILEAILPRRIVPPHNYRNPRHFSASMYSQVWCNLAGKSVDSAAISAQAVTFRLMEFGVPTYFIAEDFCRAVAATEPPEDYFLSQLKWPMPAMLFVMPLNFMREYTGFTMPFIGLTHLTASNYQPKIKDAQYSFIPLENSRERMVLYYTPDFGNAPMDYTATYPMTHRISQFVEGTFIDYTKEYSSLIPREMLDTLAKAPSGDEDKVFCRKVNSLAVKLMLAINAAPNLIELGKLERPARIKRGKVEKEALWSPNIIGRGYRILREPSGFGSEISPRMHWRRGHFTNQARGPRHLIVKVADMPKTPEGKIDWNRVDDETKEKFLASHEIKWIEPKLVNAE